MNPAPKEIVLKGIGVSPGVVVGPAFLLTSEDVRATERDITPDEAPREIARFEAALIATRRQLHEIQQKVERALDQSKASIFDAHLLVVDDRAFVEEVIVGLESQRKNVETVLRQVAEKYAATLARMDDDYLRERAADVRDVTRRVLRNLSGQTGSALAQLTQPCIVVAADVAPSDTASMNRERVIGFATDLGSPTAHTAIMARALEIPAVVGLHDASLRVSAGDTLLVDGGKGLLILHPTPERLEHYGAVARAQETIRHELEALRDQPAQTRDGYNVTLAANIELPHDVEAVVRHGAAGIGLYRTEFLFLGREHLPDEAEQFAAYEEVAKRLSPQPVIIRTLDIGGDKFLSSRQMPQESNPFLGWRAIRYCLAQPDVFLAQLRAILRASRHANVKIMYPMISTVDELIQANRLLEQAKRELCAEGAAFDPQIEVGCMIEVPSAALTAHLLAPHVKYFSIGTNDLIQYTLAVDRVNERIAYLYEPTHPAVVRLIKQVVDISHESGIWTGVCGEMAGNPVIAPLLIGLGVDELSVSPNLVPLVKNLVRKMYYHDAERLAARAMLSESAEEILNLCRDVLRRCAPEILELVE